MDMETGQDVVTILLFYLDFYIKFYRCKSKFLILYIKIYDELLSWTIRLNSLSLSNKFD